MALNTKNSPRTPPWSKERDVVEVLLQSIVSPESITLYRFLEPAYPLIHSYVSRFSVRDFARNPWRCVGEADCREKVWDSFPRLLWQFLVLALRLVYYAGPPEGWGPREWEVWRELLKVDETDPDVIDGLVWRTCRIPQSSGMLEAPYPIGHIGTIPMPHPREPSSSP